MLVILVFAVGSFISASRIALRVAVGLMVSPELLAGIGKKEFMKKAKTQYDVMKSVRKYTTFIGKAYGTPKGAKGYNRKNNKNWKEE